MDKILNTRACLGPDELKGYLDNTLSEDQRFDIENHLLDCPLCEAALEGFAAANPKLASEHLREIEAAIPNLAAGAPARTTQAPDATIKRLPRWRNWTAAAAAIGFLLLCTVLYRQYAPQSSAQLFAQSYKTYESPFAGTRASSSTASSLKEGYAAYQDNDYAKALPLFEATIAQDDVHFIAHFHAGLSSLQLGELSKAQRYLELTRYNSEAFYGAATWYLALSYLKEGQVEQCQQFLMEIKKEDQEYYPLAQKLLGKL